MGPSWGEARRSRFSTTVFLGNAAVVVAVGIIGKVSQKLGGNFLEFSSRSSGKTQKVPRRFSRPRWEFRWKCCRRDALTTSAFQRLITPSMSPGTTRHPAASVSVRHSCHVRFRGLRGTPRRVQCPCRNGFPYWE